MCNAIKCIQISYSIQLFDEKSLDLFPVFCSKTKPEITSQLDGILREFWAAQIFSDSIWEWTSKESKNPTKFNENWHLPITNIIMTDNYDCNLPQLLRIEVAGA